MSTLERGIELAARAHAGQVDKAGQPYILHPLRLMAAVRTSHERMAAVLHDIVEGEAACLRGMPRRPPSDWPWMARPGDQRSNGSAMDGNENNAAGAIRTGGMP